MWNPRHSSLSSEATADSREWTEILRFSFEPTRRPKRTEQTLRHPKLHDWFPDRYLPMHVSGVPTLPPMDRPARMVSDSFFIALLVSAVWDPVFAVTGLTVPFLLKLCIRRPRPSQATRTAMEPLRGPDRYGCPSGHAFFGGMLAQRLGTIPSILYAVLLGVSRYVLGQHDVVDVASGWVMGAGFEMIVRGSLPAAVWWIVAMLGGTAYVIDMH